MKVQVQTESNKYKSSGFLKHYQDLIRTVVIPYQYEVLNDRIEGIEKSHAIQNFINAAKVLNGDNDHDGFYGMVFQDSDVAKWIEAAAYSLSAHPDEKLEKTVDEVIDIVAAAQDKDGYLNTYYTIKDQDKRWTNLLEGHELYCAGHMMEAAVAYYEATGKTALIEVMKKNADHIYNRFINDEVAGYPGHPEIELALMKLYRATGEKRYLELAEYFIDVRGVDPSFFEKEASNRGWNLWGSDGKDCEYNQSMKPVREQTDAVGHSVRAVYLYTAMADIASITEEKELIKACENLWKSIVTKRMYVTGAIGSTVLGEAFTVDYNLPNDTAYGETCASIGLMYFASRMLECEVDGEYADVMEKAFYNTVLAGMQLDGKRFFYVNPLEVIPGVSGIAQTHKHTLPERPGWHACACCPPNVARTVSSIAKYAYGENDNTAFCHMFADGTIEFNNGIELECSTNYPYELNVRFRVVNGSGKLAIHIPGWSHEAYSVLLGDKAVTTELNKGYIYIDINKDDEITIQLDERVKKIYCSPMVASNTGYVAVQRGPLIYCAEGVDNGNDILGLTVKENGNIASLDFDENLLSGIVPIEVEGYRTEKIEGLYTDKKPVNTPCKIKMIPYYAWGNRGLNQMRVWLPER